MKKLLLILSITLISNLIFAAFPINEKSQTESVQTSNFGDNNNRNILLLALAPIPLAVIAVIAFSAGSFGFILGSIFGFSAFISAVYSIYLNLRTDISSWDWRNYFSILSAVVLGALALLWTIIVMSFGGIG